jgi:dTDP-4-amino-4,6-dideoxygalactose transaminase
MRSRPGRGAQLTVWPTLSPGVYLRRPRPALPFPLDQRNGRLLAWGRHAVWHGVRAIGLEPGDELLMPAYHHGSEVEAVIRSGLVPRFYDSDRRLEPREQELDALLAPRTRALYLTHFLGFPQNSARWRRWCDERGLLLIEDAAQAWLASIDGRPVGSFGDLGFFCLYKTFGLPEGAAVVCSPPVERRPLDARLGVGPTLRKHAAWLAGRSAAFTWLVTAVRRQGTPDADPASEFGLRSPEAMPWRTTTFLLRRLADPRAAAIRRAHYRTLLDVLGDRVPPPFDELSEGASPFAFPLTVEHKRSALEYLAAAGIKALDLWSLRHPALPEDGFPEAAARRASTIALPVHQELRSGDLTRMAALVVALSPP